LVFGFCVLAIPHSGSAFWSCDFNRSLAQREDC
jgi:hypothetical protein